MADTSLTFHAQASWGTPASTAPVVRDHRLPAPAPAYGNTQWTQRPATVFGQGTWISLAEPMNLARGRHLLDLNTSAKLNQIRLQSTSGQAFIGTLTVQYVNGASQVITLNQWIDSRNPMAQFNLNRTAQVDSILINGSRSQRGGKFQVFGYATSTRPTPPIYQPERPPVYQPPVYVPQRTIPLANSMTLAWTRGSKEISVGYNMGSFRTIRLTGVTGDSIFSHVLVSFTNGHEQMIPVKRTLKGGETIDLNLDSAGRGSIARLVVFQTDSTDVVGPSAGVFNVAAQ
jgi:hypothetical protein